ncbi:MAG: AMP-binding protein [Deltaproteobacteria bacterium]|nr:AMP-binding protein [Deltaproteobacteria bacterium]
MDPTFIDWHSAATHLFTNPRCSAEVKNRFERLYTAAPKLSGHIWLPTSGTTGKMKLVALSKPAFLASAEAVNAHLESDSTDNWLLTLPLFHVGGLGILARAHLSGAQVTLLESWDTDEFYKRLTRQKCTLTSLVPTQVFDLAQRKLLAPSHLRGIIVGGGALSDRLYTRTRELGWNLLPSYGLTECASQVATATLADHRLKILNHIQVRCSQDGFLQFKGDSLLMGYIAENEKGIPAFVDPKIDGWFTSEDRGRIEDDFLIFEGRAGEMVKVGGENVDLASLENVLQGVLLEQVFSGDAAIVALPDERLGTTIHLVYTNNKGIKEVVDKFNACVLPFERIRHVHYLARIPRSSLGKVLKKDLKRMI